jgi:hypothetical protein
MTKVIAVTDASKKTSISTRSALPQALVYMMAKPESALPLFGVLTNGDDIVFVKLVHQATRQYQLSRSFSMYTLVSELRSALQILKRLGQVVTGSDR